MEERFLRNVAILCSAIGLALLFYISNAMEAPSVKIGDIGIDDVGISVRVCGLVEGKSISNNHVFMDIKDDTGGIRLVVFNSTALKLRDSGVDLYNILKGESICSAGVVSEYPRGSGIVELIYRSGRIGRA